MKKTMSTPTNLTINEVPRTLSQRKKNWLCVFPGCTEPPKTRYNCYVHVWDRHVRHRLADTVESNDVILTSFKESNQKEVLKQLCEPYMKKLVDKQEGKQSYPFAFNESLAPAITLALEQIPTQHPAADSTLFYPANNTPSSTSTSVVTDESMHMATDSARIATEKGATQSVNVPVFSMDHPGLTTDDLLKIRQINSRLKQLQMMGEIFADDGFLVRSDERSKEHIQSISHALSGLNQLYGKRYNYITDPSGHQSRYGFIAQEVQMVYPELVTEDSNGVLSVDIVGLIPVMVEALKEVERQVQSMLTKSQSGLEELDSSIQNVVSKLVAAERELQNTRVIYRQCLTKNQSAVKKSRIKYDLLHCFGPTLFLVISAITFTVVSIIFPLVQPYYIIESVFIIISIAQWAILMLNQRDLRDLIIKRETFLDIFWRSMDWGIYQLVSWSVVLVLIVGSVSLTLVLGAFGVIVTVVYLLSFFCLLILVVTLYHSMPTKSTSSIIILSITTVFHFLCIVAVICVISFQRL